MTVIDNKIAQRFVQQVGLADVAGLLDQHGRATPALEQRIERAIMVQTFGRNPATQMICDLRLKVDGAAKALLAAAPDWAAMRVAAQDGTIAPDFDITAHVVAAITHADLAARRHLSLGDYASHGSIESIHRHVIALLPLFEDNCRLLADGLATYARDALSAGSQNMFGQMSPEEVLVAAVRRAKPLQASAPRRQASAAMYGESGHRRIADDSYFTLDADWIVPALLRNLDLRGPVFEPSAGKGHLIDELVKAGFKVTATDLHDYGRADVKSGVDLFSLTAEDMAHCGSIVANLPYDVLGDATQHLCAIAEANRMQFCSLVRAEWPIARSGGREALIHRGKHLDRIIYLTKRPRWVEERTASPRHWFAWVCWDFSRGTSKPATVHFDQ